jgi:hypothetical protein
MSEWRGHNIETFRDIHRLLAEVVLHGTQADANDLAATLESVNPRARDNIGYLAGYFDRDTGDQILRMFRSRHPVFGNGMPLLRDAFALGQRVAATLPVCVDCGTADPRHCIQELPGGPICGHCQIERHARSGFSA